MLDPILDKLDFSGPNLGTQALTLCLILYLVVLFCTCCSIGSQGFQPRNKLLWVAIVILVPFVGILLYLVACIYLKLQTHPAFESFIRHKSKGKHGTH